MTGLLSTIDNCLFYNALTLNGDPQDDIKVLILQKFRENNSQSTVIDYYTRSSALLRKIRQNSNIREAFWKHVTDVYVNPIVEDLVSNNNTQALSKVYKMLADLEREI